MAHIKSEGLIPLREYFKKTGMIKKAFIRNIHQDAKFSHNACTVSLEEQIKAIENITSSIEYQGSGIT